jgi:hypothetical protein
MMMMLAMVMVMLAMVMAMVMQSRHWSCSSSWPPLREAQLAMEEGGYGSRAL